MYAGLRGPPLPVTVEHGTHMRVVTNVAPTETNHGPVSDRDLGLGHSPHSNMQVSNQWSIDQSTRIKSEFTV